MKKLLVTTTLLGSLLSSFAMAKTEGNYVGLNLIRTGVKAGKQSALGVTLSNSEANNIKNGNRYSLGLSYKYAFNFNNFFVAPGAFLDYNNVAMKDDFDQEWKLSNRIGARVDLGYDIVDNVAIYTHVGFARNSFNVKTAGSKDVKSSQASLLYGGGLKFAVNENISLNAEYEISKTKPEFNSYGVKATQEFDIKTARIGASYRF